MYLPPVGRYAASIARASLSSTWCARKTVSEYHRMAWHLTTVEPLFAEGA